MKPNILKLRIIYFTLLLIVFNYTNVFSQNATEQTSEFDDLHQKGIEYFKNEEYSVAITHLQQADIINPNNYSLATYLGFTCKEVNLYASAIGYFENAVNINTNYISLGNLGAIYGDLGRYKVSLEYLDKALSENPSNEHALTNKGFILIERGKYNEALEFFNEAIDTGSPLPQTFLSIGEVYKNMGQLENALLYFDKALAIESTFSEAVLMKVNVLNGLGKPLTEYKSICDSVIKEESNTLSKNPQNYKSLYYRASAYKFLGEDKQMTADLYEGINILNNLIPLYPQASALFSWRANMYKMLEDTNTATQDYQKVLQLEPENIAAIKYLEKNYSDISF